MSQASSAQDRKLSRFEVERLRRFVRAESLPSDVGGVMALAEADLISPQFKALFCALKNEIVSGLWA